MNQRALVRASRRPVALYGVLALICAAGLIGFLLESSLVGAVFAGVLTLVWVAFTVRGLRHGIFTSGNQLINRNDLGTRAISWPHIERFQYDQFGGLGVRTRDDALIVLQQMPERRALLALDVLNHELEQSRSNAPKP